MPIITLTTFIKAPAARCFDLARSMELHQISTQQTGERAIAGRTSGLIELHESVTWRARHFGVWQTLTSKITAFEYPHFFVDEMQEGAFTSFRHEHHFREEAGATLMTDVFQYQAPLGMLGVLADGLFLKRYMRRLLQERNSFIKHYAETEHWQEVLPVA